MLTHFTDEDTEARGINLAQGFKPVGAELRHGASDSTVCAWRALPAGVYEPGAPDLYFLVHAACVACWGAGDHRSMCRVTASRGLWAGPPPAAAAKG